MTLLEGLSLWSGESVIAAISVDASARGIYEWSLFGELLPSDNALVQIDFVEPRQPRRLRGLGSFRDVLALERLR